MAYYKYTGFLANSTSEAYDKVYAPGTPVPYSGIYRCEGCGREIAANHGRDHNGGPQVLPPENHHQHTNDRVPIRWRLTIYADHEPKST